MSKSRKFFTVYGILYACMAFVILAYMFAHRPFKLSSNRQVSKNTSAKGSHHYMVALQVPSDMSTEAYEEVVSLIRANEEILWDYIEWWDKSNADTLQLYRYEEFPIICSSKVYMSFKFNKDGEYEEQTVWDQFASRRWHRNRKGIYNAEGRRIWWDCGQEMLDDAPSTNIILEKWT